MDRTLQAQQNEVFKHQEYFAESKITRYHLTTVALLIAAFFIGWKMDRKEWGSKVMHQIVDIGKLALLNSVKKTVFSLFLGNFLFKNID